MNLGPHAAFIVAAYAAAIVIVAGLIGWVTPTTAGSARCSTISRRAASPGARTRRKDAPRSARTIRRRHAGKTRRHAPAPAHRLLPLLVFLALAALFLLRLGAGDPSRIPSALIGRPAPADQSAAARRPRARRQAGARLDARPSTAR